MIQYSDVTPTAPTAPLTLLTLSHQYLVRFQRTVLNQVFHHTYRLRLTQLLSVCLSFSATV